DTTHIQPHSLPDDLPISLKPRKQLLAIAVSLALSPAVSAQEPAQQRAERSIEVIEVSATRQTENLQDVPIAVTALSANELEKMHDRKSTRLNSSHVKISY